MVHLSIPLIATIVFLNSAASLAVPISEGEQYQRPPGHSHPEGCTDAYGHPGDQLHAQILSQGKVGRGPDTYISDKASGSGDIAPAPPCKDRQKDNQNVPQTLRVVLYIARKALFSWIDPTLLKVVVRVSKVNAKKVHIHKSVVTQHTSVSAVKNPLPGEEAVLNDAGKPDS